MLDKIMGQYASYKFNTLDDTYNPEKAIQSSTLHNENAATLAVLFPPWRGGEGAYDRLTKRLIHNGSAVLRYKFHPQILEPDTERVLASFDYIQKTIAEQLERQTRTHAYDRVNLVATSLGNVSLALVAKTFTTFDSATLIVPGSNLARCVWEGSRTQGISNSFQNQGLNEAKLDALWARLAPKAAIGSFKDKEVHMIISETDMVIPAPYQEEMAALVSKCVPNMNITTTHLGHIASVVKFCMSGTLPSSTTSL